MVFNPVPVILGGVAIKAQIYAEEDEREMEIFTVRRHK
jgi:hypothetical protein